MPEFDLDHLKKAWQDQPVGRQYDTSEIVDMLNQKSRNYVKYIFWISVVEFLFFLSLTVFYVFSSQENNSFLNILERLGVDINDQIHADFEHLYFVIKVVSLVVTAFFVVRFYQNYRKIRIESTLKKFILQIIRFKKTVNAFILTNILLIIVITIVLIYFVLHTLSAQQIDLDSATLSGLIIGFVVSFILCLVLVWAYYRLVYGIIMGRLSNKLKQLEDIEKEKITE